MLLLISYGKRLSRRVAYDLLVQPSLYGRPFYYLSIHQFQHGLVGYDTVRENTWKRDSISAQIRVKIQGPQKRQSTSRTTGKADHCQLEGAIV